MKLLERIRNLPQRRKKIILWLVLVVSGAFLFSFWFSDVKKSVKNLDGGEFKKELNFPKIEWPEFKLPGI